MQAADAWINPEDPNDYGLEIDSSTPVHTADLIPADAAYNTDQNTMTIVYFSTYTAATEALTFNMDLSVAIEKPPVDAWVRMYLGFYMEE